MFNRIHLKAGLTALAILLLAACGKQEQQNFPTTPLPQKPLNYHAIVIGISDYSGTGWSQLITAGKDAKSIGHVLRRDFGFQVTELLDQQASRKQILQTLDQTMNLTEQDALLIYFAGHGFYDEKMKEGYWIPHAGHLQNGNLPAKDEWLWNSSISRIVTASPAKHVLVIADTCYGGSLFRGNAKTDKTKNWYRRALGTPSRYLITSGNLEPVLDSGISHSIFAQEILNYIQYSEQDIFSASDIGVSIRKKVSELTGQLVRMGPMLSPADAGGEFVFVRNTTALPPSKPAETASFVIAKGTQRGPIEDLSTQLKSSTHIRPRILACIGPTGKNDDEAALIRARLHQHLSKIGGCIIVEREALDTLLEELNLSTSGKTDHRATAQIGKLLPASLIMFGEILPNGSSKEIHLRIVDTETSKVLNSIYAAYSNNDNLTAACSELAQSVMTTMNKIRPVLLPALQLKNNQLQADWGNFHGARVGDTFNIITIENKGSISEKETVIGVASLLKATEETSIFECHWLTPPTTTTLWLKTMP